MALTQRSLIFTIFLKNWGQDEWCQQEVEASSYFHLYTYFLTVPVCKNEPKRERLPLLNTGHQAHAGYRFFTSEAPDNQYSKKFIRMQVATACTNDDELAISLTILVQGYGLSVQPYFPENYSSLALSQHIVLFLWNTTKSTDLQSLLSRLILSAQTICLHHPRGNKAARCYFCQKNILLKKIDTLPINWLEIRKRLLPREDEP